MERIGCGVMGLLLFILRKSWSMVAMAFGITFFIAILNCDPIATPLLGNTTAIYLRDAINPCITLISALIGGMLAQSIGIIYSLFQEAVKKHKEELDAVAKELLDKLNKRVAHRVHESSVLYLYIEAPICSAFEEVKKRTGGLLDDLGFHWEKVGELFDRLERVCRDVNKFNSEYVKRLDEALRKYLEETVKAIAPTALPGVDVALYTNFLQSILYQHMIPSIINSGTKFQSITFAYVQKLFQEHIKGFSVEQKDSGLWIRSFNIGNASKDMWMKHGVQTSAQILYNVLNKYAEKLDEYVEKGRKYIEELHKIANNLRKELGYITNTKMLPLKKICRYIR